MRRTERFDHCVTRRGATFSLKFLLQHRFVIGLRGTERIGRLQFRAECATNKLRCRVQTAVEKNRTRDRFEDIREQCVLLAAATLLFTAPETQEVAELQRL